MPSWGDSFEVMLRLKLPRGNFNLAVMNNLYWSSGRFSGWRAPPGCPAWNFPFVLLYRSWIFSSLYSLKAENKDEKVIATFSWWGSPKASHIQASQLRFPHFPRFRVRSFCVFRIFAPWNLLKPLFSWGERDLPHFPHFPPFESLISKIRPTGFFMTGLRW